MTQRTGEPIRRIAKHLITNVQRPAFVLSIISIAWWLGTEWVAARRYSLWLGSELRSGYYVLAVGVTISLIAGVAGIIALDAKDKFSWDVWFGPVGVVIASGVALLILLVGMDAYLMTRLLW